MGQALETRTDQGTERSRALDAICALGVAASGADLAIITRLGADGHGVAGRHGSLEPGWSALLDQGGALDESLTGAAAVEALALRVNGAAAGMVLLARREGAFAGPDQAVLFRLRDLAEAQMAAEDVLRDVTRAAFRRIEAVRA